MKKSVLLFVLLFASSLIFLAGCYGLQNPAQCDGIDQVIDKMRCYRRAAINAAYASDENAVRVLCERINNIGYTYGQLGSNDIRRQAETEKNRCYYDAAIIMGKAKPQEALQLCYEITESSNVFGLKTTAATQESCEEEVGRLAGINPANYYSNPSNICALVGILLLPLAVLLFNRAVHKF